VAAENARLNSLLRLIYGRDARVLVTEVPILAPRMADEVSKTPPATMPTTIEVVDDDDWIIDVDKIPIKRPTIGLLVVWMSDLANSLPNIFSEDLINSRLKKNKYKENNQSDEVDEGGVLPVPSFDFLTTNVNTGHPT
jgi:hypothetical protein